MKEPAGRIRDNSEQPILDVTAHSVLGPLEIQKQYVHCIPLVFSLTLPSEKEMRLVWHDLFLIKLCQHPPIAAALLKRSQICLMMCSELLLGIDVRLVRLSLATAAFLFPSRKYGNQKGLGSARPHHLPHTCVSTNTPLFVTFPPAGLTFSSPPFPRTPALSLPRRELLSVVMGANGLTCF